LSGNQADPQAGVVSSDVVRASGVRRRGIIAPFLYVSARLIASYLIWHWGWSKRRAPLASLADPF
jgi:hypothetical protein